MVGTRGDARHFGLRVLRCVAAVSLSATGLVGALAPAGAAPLGTEATIKLDPTDVNFARFGASTASAGDVNGDGYDDVLVGADFWGISSGSEGRAYLYLGSPSGLAVSPAWTADPADQTAAQFGGSVSSAGDVNADGYDDVIVGAPAWDLVGTGGQVVDEGRAYLYLGSASGLSGSPAWTADPADQEGAHFGRSVASAGDVNGDGYDDVIVGADGWDSSSANSEGRAYVYLGSAFGLTLPITRDPTDELDAAFGHSVDSAGDVDNDGYDDVIVGAPNADGLSCGGQLCQFVAGEGRVYLYRGSASGLSVNAPSVIEPTNQAGASFGSSVSSAGDVNNDGHDDVVVGATGWDGAQSNEGRAYLHMGSASGLLVNPSWTVDPTDQAAAGFGRSLDSAGDVNGDGYGDLVIGVPAWDGWEEDEGRSYLYLGSGSVPANTPAWVADATDQEDSFFGRSVASAGDIDDNGYDDLAVGADQWNGTVSNEGRVYIYENPNLSPVLGSIGDKTVAENDLLTFTADATDANGDTLTYSAQNLPSGASLNAATGVFSWTPTFTQAGRYPNVKIIVSDGSRNDAETFEIVVSNVNRAPVLGSLTNASVNEGQALQFNVTATDPDGGMPTVNAPLLPPGATFSSGSGSGVFSWTPTDGQDGSYLARFSASDGVGEDFEEIYITVNDTIQPTPNRAPVLDRIGNKSVDEGDALTFSITASDADDDAITFDAKQLPPGATFDSSTHEFSWTPTYEQAGVWSHVEFEVTDGDATDSESIYITVFDAPKPPTTTTLSMRLTRRAVKVGGAVTPAHAGGKVIVTLSRKAGASYTKVASKNTILDALSAYKTSFPKPTRGSYKITSKFTGDADHAPSTKVVLFTI